MISYIKKIKYLLISVLLMTSLSARFNIEDVHQYDFIVCGTGAEHYTYTTFVIVKVPDTNTYYIMDDYRWLYDIAYCSGINNKNIVAYRKTPR